MSDTYVDKEEHSDISPARRGGAADLNERRRAALSEIDNAKFGWFHVRAVLVGK